MKSRPFCLGSFLKGNGLFATIRAVSPKRARAYLVRCRLLLPSLPGSRHCRRAGDSHHLLEAAAGRSRRQLLRMAGSEFSLGDQSLGRTARPRLAPRSASHAYLSSIRHAEPGRRDPPLLGRVLPTAGRTAEPLSRTDSSLRYLRGPQHPGRAARAAGLCGSRRTADCQRENARQRSARASQAKVGAAERR